MVYGESFMKEISLSIFRVTAGLILAVVLASCVGQPSRMPPEPAKRQPVKVVPGPEAMPTETVKSEQTVADPIDVEPSAKKEPSAHKEPSANKEPSAHKEPSAEQEPPPLEEASNADKTDQRDDVSNESDLEQDHAEIEQPTTTQEPEVDPTLAAAAVRDLCERIGNKLGSVKQQDCFEQPLTHGGTSTNGLSLAYRDYLPVADRKPLGRVLVLGGIHGDEFSSVSVMFKWLKILDQHHSGLFHWRFVPVTNPDGLLQKKSQRQNANGVDLNRNFPTSDWVDEAHRYWRENTYRNPRRYPGPAAASEVETQWIIDQIESFNPDVVISMHAPYHLVDYDGPPKAPDNLGGLYLRKLGVYPGSLGNFVGVDMNKPIVTVELKSAGIMPTRNEIETMWGDLVQWLRRQLGS